MKKIYALFAAVLMTVSLSAASYGILVNGKTYFAGELTGEFEGFTQYLAHVPVQSGDYLQLCDAENKAVWAVALNSYSEPGFTYDPDNKRYTASVTGCYDFYIKLKYEQDELYIGNGSNCGEGIDISGQGGGDQGGQGGGNGSDDDVLYYAMGWINAADAGETAYETYDDKYLFEDGKLTIDCKFGSYIGIKDHMRNYYYFRGTDDCHEDQVTLEWANGWSPCKKWAIPEGVNYIIIISAEYKGNIVLKRVDKATYDAYHWGGSQDIDNTTVNEKARKVIIDGQLRIVRGDKVFDATGRQL